MAKNISVDEVKKLAKLSQISLSDEAISELAKQMDDILDYVKQLESVETKDVEPTSQVTGLKNANRPDEAIDYHVTPEKLLENTPDSQDGSIKTKRIL